MVNYFDNGLSYKKNIIKGVEVLLIITIIYPKFVRLIIIICNEPQIFPVFDFFLSDLTFHWFLSDRP